MAGPPLYEFAPESQPGVSKTPKSPTPLVTGEELKMIESKISQAESDPSSDKNPPNRRLDSADNQKPRAMSEEQDDEKGDENGDKKSDEEELILSEEIPPILVNDDEQKRQNIAEKLGIK